MPKKCKELRDLCVEAIDQVKLDADDDPLSANKYFRIMKLALDTKIPRLTEQILYCIQKLVAHGLMDGNHPDDTIYPDDDGPKSNGMLPRKLIDAIVDEVCKCTAERDQQVQLQVVRALLTIVATNTTEVHERSLLKVLSSLYYIHIACPNQVNQNTAKASLIQLISIVFKKMEHNQGDFSETLKRLSGGDGLQQSDLHSEFQPSSAANSHRRHTDVAAASDLQRINSKGTIEARSQEGMPSLRQRHDRSSEEQKAEETLTTQLNDEQTLVTFSPEEQYAQVTLTYIVDNVCLHLAKVEEIGRRYDNQIKVIQEAGNSSESAVKKLQESMIHDQQQVSLLAVPKSSKAKKKEEKSAESEIKPIEIDGNELKLVNELGIPSGKFGWCVSCRSEANLYCKHTRHPVCSFECKQRHIQLIEEANASEELDLANTPRSTALTSQAAPEDQSLRDALLVFNKLCQLLQNKDMDKKLDNVYEVRKMLLGLDLIHSCLENSGPTFTSRNEFIVVIRDSLCSALLKFAVSSEHKIFSRTISIFYCLFLHFREHLKQTISVFIDNFFLRILDSGNSEYDYKYSILEFFDRLSENPDHILEIFVNYDCDIGQKDICVRIIESVTQIAQGKFQRNDHTSLITTKQEQSLRRQALEVLVKVLRNLNRTIEAAQKLEEQARIRLDKIRHERETLLHKQTEMRGHDEDDSNSRDNQSLLNDLEEPSEAANNAKKPLLSNKSQIEEQADAHDANQQKQNRIFKSEMTKAAGKFNLKPKNGVKYLIDKGYLPKEQNEEQIKGIVKFLKTTPALSATSIGEFLGESKDLNKEVLQAYINEFDWGDKEITFVGALKQFLQGFRIPGEGQIVDKFMEIFGEKLAKDRPEEFGNAEGVYILSYATLMLQTSIHNQAAQKLKMTLNDFKKITKGVKLSESGQPDFEAFLTDVYDTVLREPFTLEEDEEARMKLESAQGTNKKILFDKEREGIFRRGANMMKQDQKNNRFVLIKDISTIQPLFENIWSAALALFSVVLDETDDQIIADLCLQGFMHAIRISGHYENEDVRNAFVSSLSKFTQVSTTKEIKQKNINCIRELLNLAIYNGDCLRESWSFVLECISKIDHMRVLGLGDITDSDIFNQAQNEPGAPGQQVNEQILMKNSSIIAQQIDANQIEMIFQQSERLNKDGIIFFIENLCKVSRDELADELNPKKFCLQKLVEVASLNMNRVRFQWQSIWETLGEFFTWVGSHKNLNVIIYAIDSLRQLADKFLEKEEKRHFSYQKMFLKPFEDIMKNNLMSQQKEIKEYIVMCMAALCHQKAKFIKSGWDVILNIFSIAAQDSESHLVVQSIQSLEHATANHFHLLEEFFLDLISCLGKFASHGQPQIQTRTIKLLKLCAGELKKRPEIVQAYQEQHGQQIHGKNLEEMKAHPPAYGIRSQFMKSVNKKVPGSKEETLQGPETEGLSVTLSVQKSLWFSILRILASLVVDKQEMVRTEALEALIQILEEHHAAFGELLWREIFSQIIFPLLTNVRVNIESGLKN